MMIQPLLLLCDVPLDVKDSDGGDLNAIAIMVEAGTHSSGNDFVDEKSVPGIGLEWSIGCGGQ